MEGVFFGKKIKNKTQIEEKPSLLVRHMMHSIFKRWNVATLLGPHTDDMLAIDIKSRLKDTLKTTWTEDAKNTKSQYYYPCVNPNMLGASNKMT